MKWINDTQSAINFIENNILENISVEDVSNHIHSNENNPLYDSI